MFEVVERDGARTVVLENGEQRALANDNVAAVLVDEIERLRTGFARICDGLERGDIGDDVVWLDQFQTLWEFCADLIGREEPLGDALREPTEADIKYLVDRLKKLISELAVREGADKRTEMTTADVFNDFNHGRITEFEALARLQSIRCRRSWLERLFS